MACSVYGAQYLLEALYNAGEAEHALNLMTSESKRSWMNMLYMGSTMTTEAWDEYYKPNLTVNGEKVKPVTQIHYLKKTRNMLRLKSGNHRISATK